MSTWMYDVDMDKLLDKAREGENLWYRVATSREASLNSLVKRLIELGEVNWLITHPDEDIRGRGQDCYRKP